jgi:hypothetical protein
MKQNLHRPQHDRIIKAFRAAKRHAQPKSKIGKNVSIVKVLLGCQVLPQLLVGAFVILEESC